MGIYGHGIGNGNIEEGGKAEKRNVVLGADEEVEVSSRSECSFLDNGWFFIIIIIIIIFSFYFHYRY